MKPILLVSAGSGSDFRDSRIKAIVAAAPALGFTFDRAGLAGVTIPVQLWRANDDHILPTPFYADAVKGALPRQPEFHTVPKAGHFDFLAPCADPTSMPQLCQSASGLDRIAFHDASIERWCGSSQTSLLVACEKASR